MKIKPLRDQVFLIPIEEPKKTKVLLPDSARKELTQEGEIFAVGPDCVELGLKKGDKVLFTASPVKVKLDETEYLVMSEKDIVAKID